MFNQLMKRFFLGVSVAWPILAAIYYFRGQALAGAIRDGLIWSVISVGFYTWALWRNTKNRRACAICSIATPVVKQHQEIASDPRPTE